MKRFGADFVKIVGKTVLVAASPFDYNPTDNSKGEKIWLEFLMSLNTQTK
jgi:hypothetical protein